MTLTQDEINREVASVLSLVRKRTELGDRRRFKVTRWEITFLDGKSYASLGVFVSTPRGMVFHNVAV